MKKYIAILLSLLLLMTFAAACGTARTAEPQKDPQQDLDVQASGEEGSQQEPVEAADETVDEEELRQAEREKIIGSINPDELIGGKPPYYIKVNILQNCVTIYSLDDNLEYTIPVKAMICSAGREGHESPKGDYEITSVRPRWCYMVDGSYGQYCSGWRKGGYLFHSACYSKQSEDSLIVSEYNDLGNNASLGCIRLQVIDAKWIYENCMIGTPVTIYEDQDPGPLGKPAKLVEYIDEEMNNGWDPTDPNEANPWHAILSDS